MTAEPTLLRALRAEPLDVALRAPFGIAGGAQDSVRNVLVTVELHDGTLGYGEAAPFPAFNGETQGIAMGALEEARARVEGADVREWRRIAASLEGLAPSARCAVETAVLDALTKRAGVPLWAFFGGAERELTTDITVTTGTVNAARATAREVGGEGYSCVKVKVGGGRVDDDVARLVAIQQAAPDVSLIVDGNGGMTAAATLTLVDEARRAGVRIALLEQPVPATDWAAMREVAARAGVPVAADEAATSAADVVRLASERAAHVINIKLMKSGIVEGLRVAETAKALGLGLMIGGMVESVLAMATSACFAAGLGGFSFVDLDTPLFFAENPFNGGYEQHGPRLDLRAIAYGHGVSPKRG